MQATNNALSVCVFVCVYVHVCVYACVYVCVMCVCLCVCFVCVCVVCVCLCVVCRTRNVEGKGHIVCRPVGSNLLVVQALPKAVHRGLY